MKKFFTLLFILTQVTAAIHAQQTQAVALPVCGALPSPTITGHSVAFTSGTTADVTITWTGSGATSYSLWYKPTGTTWVQVCGGASTFSCTVHNLNLEWEYSFQVRASRYCKLINGEPDEETTTADLRFRLPPPAPTGLAVSYQNATSFVAVWTYIQSVGSYFVDVSTSPTFNTLVLNNVKVREANSIVVNHLIPNTTYYYRVRALSSSGLSPNSATYAVKLVIAAPQWIKVIPIQYEVYHLIDWGSSDGATSYWLEWSTDPSFYPTASSIYVTTDTVSQMILGVDQVNTIYYVRVLAAVDNYTSDWSPTVTLFEGPRPPFAIDVTNVTSTSFTATWEKGRGVTESWLEVSDHADFDPTNGLYHKYDVGADTTVTATGLAPGGHYYYRVIVGNGISGVTNYSRTWSVDLLPNTLTTSWPIADDVISVYPNPGNGQFKVNVQFPESASGEQVEIRVLHASGETVSRIAREAGSFTESLDLSAQPLGIYTVQLAYQGRVIHKKIVKF